MAIIQTDNGDFFGGIETSLEAEKFLKKNDSITNQLKSSNYNNLALANDELENFDKKFSYIDGLQFIPEHYERDFSSDVPDEIEEFGRNLSKKRDDFKFYKAVFERKPTWTAEFKKKKSELEALKKEYQLLVPTTNKLV